MSQSPRETPDEDEAPVAPSPPEDDNQRPGADSEAMNADEPGEPTAGYEFEVKEQDRWLPIANVARIMKYALPENAKIAKEAKECMQECVSEFISFITSEASEKCQQEKRKTVNGEDILFAMTSLGFENYGEALKIYLARYREGLVQRGEQKPGSGGNAAGAGAGAGQMGNDGTGGYENSHGMMSHPVQPPTEAGYESYGNANPADF